MAETPWVNGVVGDIDSSEILHAANTAVNVYGYSVGDILTLQKKAPDSKFYPHKVSGSAVIGARDSSFIILTPGIYRIVGVSKKLVHITWEAI